MWKKERDIYLPLDLPTVAREATAAIAGCWHAILPIWLVTGVGALVLQELILPSRIAWDENVVLPLAIFGATGALTLLGLVLVIRVVGGHAREGDSEAPGEAVVSGLRDSGKALVTAGLSGLRIVLVIVGSLPLVVLLGLLLYGAAKGTLSETVETVLIAAPIGLFAFIGVARFGWALFFSLLKSTGPVDALRQSGGLFANNRRELSLFAAVAVVVPALLYLLPGYVELPGAVLPRALAYFKSLWTFLATAFVAVAIARSEERESKG